jgi:hypothetical protein
MRIVVLTIWLSSPATAAPHGELAATYAASAPASAVAGALIGIPVTVQNTGNEIWNAAGPGPVLLTYHWETADGAIRVWEGIRTSFGTDVPPGESRTVTTTVQVPAQAGAYGVRFHLVKEGVIWFPRQSAAYRIAVQAPYAVSFGNVPIFTYIVGRTHSVDVPLTNIGTSPWNAGGTNPVRLSYHWFDSDGRVLVWDGVRTPLPSDIASGASATITATVIPPAVSPVTLKIDLVREGIAWFEFLGGTPVQFGTTVEGPRWSGRYEAPTSATARGGETRTLQVLVGNQGNVTWNATGANPVTISYHIFDNQGRVVVWDGARTALGSDLRPGESRTLTITYVAPAVGSFSLHTEAVREGIAWFSAYGSPAVATSLSVTP